MIDALAQRFHLEPAEFRRALVLGVALFALSASYTLVKTARDALFLAMYPASTLPWVYLGVGAFTIGFTGALARPLRRRSVVESLAFAGILSAFTLLAFAWLLGAGVRWGPFAFYLWVNVYGLLLLTQFWNYANSISDAREAKRILGLVGTGGILGALFGGLLAVPIARGLGAPALIVAGALPLAAVALLVFWRVSKRKVSHGAQPAPSRPVGETLAHPYVRWLALAALCSVVAGGLIDYQFKVELQRRYPDPVALASFLGGLQSLVSIASLGLQLFFTRWALQVLGAGWSAAVLPTGLGLGALFTILWPGFGSVLNARIWDQTLRGSLSRSAGELFFFPLEPATRRQAKEIIEAGLERAGDSITGLVILAVGVTFGVSTPVIGILTAAMVLVWVGAWLGVRRGYVSELGRNLRRMNLGHAHERVSLREASLLNEMVRLLESPYERVVLHGVELLEDNAPERLDELLPRLLDHSTSMVRARALQIVAARRLSELAARVETLLEDADPSVRVEALRTRCVLGGDHPAEVIEAFLDSPDERLRLAAIEVLVEFCEPSEEPRVLAQMEHRLQAGVPGVRRAIAHALGRRAAPSTLHDLLSRLMRDSDSETRRAALQSAGRAQRRNHIPILMDALGERAYSTAARLGLAEFGEKVVGTLSDYLTDPSVPPAVRHAVPRVLSDIGGAEAARALERCREREDVRLAYRVLKAQNRIRVRSPEIEFDRRLASEQIELDVRSGLFAFVHYRTCPIGSLASAERLFCIALNERSDQALNRVFRRLALIYDPDNMLAAYQSMTAGTARARGNALEFLENSLDPEHRALVLPLVDASGDEERLKMAEQRFGFRHVSFEHTLAEVLEGEDQWLRTCALYVVGSRREHGMMPRIVEALSSRDARVRETANWATLALGTTG